MATFEIGGIEVNGHDLIVILVQPHFAELNSQQQEQLQQQLEVCALSSGLRGTAVMLWKDQHELQVFWPTSVASLASTVTPEQLLDCVSSELVCPEQI